MRKKSFAYESYFFAIPYIVAHMNYFFAMLYVLFCLATRNLNVGVSTSMPSWWRRQIHEYDNDGICYPCSSK